MAGRVKTYNPKEVVIACGTHIVTGLADDSFVSIEANGDGVTKKVGCDGEVARSVTPDDTFKIKISLLQTSTSDTFFSNMCDLDRESGEGIFSILIKDLKGGLVFSSDAAWCTKKAPVGFGKESTNREWEIDTGSATLVE